MLPNRDFLITSLQLVLVGALAFGSPRTSTAQTFKVLHQFTGGTDGAEPAGLTLGSFGVIYGVAGAGGKPSSIASKACYLGCGTVFELSPSGENWHFHVVYSFLNYPDGAYPYAPMTIGPDGDLYGTTAGGGGGNDCSGVPCGGTVFKLQPAGGCKMPVCSAQESVLFRFTGGANGFLPGFDAPVTFDKVGNIYGTLEEGGYTGAGTCGENYGCGVVFELTSSGGMWTESVLHTFGDQTFGEFPTAGVVFDNAGNLYGTTTASNVFQMIPSGSGWDYNNLLETGDTITAGVALDKYGNIYGATETGGSSGGGSAFEMKPDGSGWTTEMIYSFGQSGRSYFPGPSATLTMDAAGNLYGATSADGAYGLGAVFKLSPVSYEPLTYAYTDLHDFTGFDGSSPSASVVLDQAGNLYGTTFEGGSNIGSGCQKLGCGVVFEITSHTE